MALLEDVICKCPECDYSGPYKDLVELIEWNLTLKYCPKCDRLMANSETGVMYCETIEKIIRGDLQEKSQEELGTEFEKELYALFNKYNAEGLKKPMMVHKAEYAVVGLRIS